MAASGERAQGILAEPSSLWTFGSGRDQVAGYLSEPTRYVSAILKLSGVASRDVLYRWSESALLKSRTEGVLFPLLWEHAFTGKTALVPCIIMAPVAAGAKLPSIESLLDVVAELKSASGGVLNVESVLLNAPIPESTVAKRYVVPRETAVSPPPSNLRQKSKKPKPIVLVGVIDDGIPFAHRNLRDANGGSRVESCWLQPVFPNSGPPSTTGLVFSRADIDTLINSHGSDEDRLYRESGALDLPKPDTVTLGQFASHGSHVIDIATGYQHGRARITGEAVEASLDQMRVIVAQLPPQGSYSSIFGQDGAVLSALHYVFAQADAIATAYKIPPPPLVVNLSYGITGGPHDGSSMLDQAIEALVLTRRGTGPNPVPTTIVLPAGNTFQDKLTGEIWPQHFHAVGNSNVFDLGWKIPPSDRSINHLELWFDANANLANLSLNVIDPSGAVGLSLPAGSFTSPIPGVPISVGGDAKGTLLSDIGGANGRSISIIIHATETSPVTERPSPGRWRVQLALPDLNDLVGKVRCRIRRDLDRPGYHRGSRQSYFDDFLDVPRDAAGDFQMNDIPAAFLRRFGSINGVAPADGAIVVAGYDKRTGKQAQYSSGGEIRNVSTAAPGHVDCCAPSDDSRVLPGRLASGTRSGSVFRMVGTSTAAPQVTRSIARAYLKMASGTASSAPPKLKGISYVDLGNALATPPTADVTEIPRHRERYGPTTFT